MKVISIQQPWASLAVLGFKKIETRSWKTNYRGELLIHASCGKNYKRLDNNNPLWSHYNRLCALKQIDSIDGLPFGAIIGKVKLSEVTTTDFYKQCSLSIPLRDRYSKPEWAQELAFGDYSPGRYGWLFSDPLVFDKPILVKGRLGLWEYE